MNLIKIIPILKIVPTKPPITIFLGTLGEIGDVWSFASSTVVILLIFKVSFTSFVKTSTVVSTIFLLSYGSVVVAEIEIIWVSVSFEIDKAEETTFVSTFNSLATLLWILFPPSKAT